MREFSTPMMQQYDAIKQQHQDCLLFFRLGDFYELFLDDALIGSRVLNITLTRRPRGKDGDIPMAGVPYHAADSYIAKLVRSGYKVAICEQVSEPNTRGIVDREVIRIVTPGTILDEKNLEAKEHNYIMAITLHEQVGQETIGIAVLDISTGDFQATELPYSASSLNSCAQVLINELTHFAPSECILHKDMYARPEVLKILSAQHGLNIYSFDSWNTYAEDSERFLKRHFQVKTLRGFGLHEKVQAQVAAAALLGYVSETQKNRIGHIKHIRSFTTNDALVLDASTIHNLELFRSIRDSRENRESAEKGTFIECIDETKTPMGGRLLRRWVREPLRSKKQIDIRLDAVEVLMREGRLRDTARQIFCRMYDMERILSRLSVGIGTPQDVINLKDTFIQVRALSDVVTPLSSTLIQECIASTKSTTDTLITYIESTISDTPPIDPKKGGVIKPGIQPKLDTLRDSIRGSKEWIAGLEQKERERTGINSLKVRFNSVFGYYIEISKAHIEHAPPEYMRKQTTVNAERFITSELQEYEDKVLRGEEMINKLEYELFLEVVQQVLTYTSDIQRSAYNVAVLDCLFSFAEIAERERYVRPSVLDTIQDKTRDTTQEFAQLKIEDGRHPVVERLHRNSLEQSFVPNDTLLDHSGQQLIVITGPNMAGKSVYMRQVALIVLMAHMGSFVPARRATIPLTDRIFVRSGAADNIGRGLSTFMVEMTETAYILHHATPNSLIIMDEIGRGTSTYDGISIAWAVAEYLVSNTEHQARTLFATHYHELQKLTEQFPEQIKNYHMAIEESGENPVFLYRLVPGGALGSYAIAVAKLAGVPAEVTKRASELLEGFKEEKTT